MKTPQTYTDATGKQWQPNTPYPMPRPKLQNIVADNMLRYWNEMTKEWIPPEGVRRGVNITHWIIVPPLPEPKTREELDLEQAEAWANCCDANTSWSKIAMDAYLAGLAAGRGEHVPMHKCEYCLEPMVCEKCKGAIERITVRALKRAGIKITD